MTVIPFDNLVPNRELWVSSTAAPGGDGSKAHPLDSIQLALAKALPGTAIMVEKGDYYENIAVPRARNGGTTEAPIWLISADGPQAAHIIAPRSDIAAIGGSGTDNFIVDGFWVTGGKNGIQFSQTKFDWHDPITNIVIRNNVVDSVVEDGVKVNGGEHVYVYNNVLSGGSDENIDFLGIVHGLIANNDVSGNTGTSAAIFVKGGSDDIRITGNYVHDAAADGISVGGWTGPTLFLRPGYDSFQARNITVDGNIVESVGKRPLAFYGAQDSTATNNFLEATDKYFTVVQVGSSNLTQYGIFKSSNITIAHNDITRDTKTLWVEAGTVGVTFTDNGLQLQLKAGADLTKLSAGVLSALIESHHLVLDDAALAAIEAALHPVSIPPVLSIPPVAAAPVLTTEQIEAAATMVKLVSLGKFFDDHVQLGGSTAGLIKGGVGTDGNDLMSTAGVTLTGGKGDDTYILGGKTGAIVEYADQGIDTISTQSRFAALPDFVENIVYTGVKGAFLQGNSADNHLVGGVGDDILSGGGGNNILEGHGGRDVYLVGYDDQATKVVDFAPGDIVSIAANPFATFADLQSHLLQIGSDTYLSLSDGRTVILKDVAATSLTASDFDYSTGSAAQDGGMPTIKIMPNSSLHIATGTAASEFLYGNGSATLIGGDGDDRYLIKGLGDHIIEHAGGGTDTAMVYTDHYALEANVENAKLKIDTGATIIGNNQANVIEGGAGDDFITGGAGADRLTGGAGSDHFVYNHASDGGGDVITDFKVGVDHLDLQGVFAEHPGGTVTTQDGSAGLEVYLHDGSASWLLATLTGVSATTPELLY